MTALLAELRQAARALLRRPLFASAAVLSLAIGIGANTAMFSVANALLLRPLPYPDPGRLAILWNRSPGIGIAEDWFSTAQYFDILRGNLALEATAIAFGTTATLTGDAEPERAGILRQSSNLLPMLGARPLLGRLFLESDDRPGRARTVILSHGLWQRRYGGDPNIAGRVIRINGEPHEVAGVLPADFSLPREVLPTLYGAPQHDLHVPLPLAESAAQNRRGEDFNLLARLKPGVSVAAAQAAMESITARLRREHPDFYPPNGRLTFSVVPLQQQVAGEARGAVLLLTGAVACVLLIACANVANLVLSFGLARRRELAVRAALGASRARLMRQLLTESLLLALAGGALGVTLAAFALGLLRTLGAGSLPRLPEVTLRPEVLLFTCAVALASGLLCGLLPAWRMAARDPGAALQQDARGAASGSLWARGHGFRRVLVAAEVALAVVLLAGAGVLLRSFARVAGVAPGFNPENVLTFELALPANRYKDAGEVAKTYQELWRRLAEAPGVAAVGAVTAPPLSQSFAWGPIVVEGRVPAAGEKFLNADMRVATPGYFAAMQIPVRRGRLFTEHDTPDQPLAVVIDEALAAQVWPNEDPLGKRLKPGGIDARPDAPWWIVVGVVGRVKQYALDADSRMALYRAHTQFPSRALTVVVRAAGDPAALTASLKREIAALDPDLPVYQARTMEDRIGASLAPRRFTLALLGAFAGVALALAALGVYGVMAYLVGQSTKEIGIRMALGAPAGRIVGEVLAQGGIVVAIGLGVGLAAAVALSRLLKSMVFGVEAADPVSFAVTAAALALVALAACVIPARRAARVDPLASLRAE